MQESPVRDRHAVGFKAARSLGATIPRHADEHVDWPPVGLRPNRPALMPWPKKDAAKRLPVPLNRRFEIRPREVSAPPDGCLAKQMHLDRAPWSHKVVRREPHKQMLPLR